MNTDAIMAGLGIATAISTALWAVLAALSSRRNSAYLRMMRARRNAAIAAAIAAVETEAQAPRKDPRK